MDLKEKKVRDEILAKTKEYFQIKYSNINNFIEVETKINYAGRVFDEKEIINLVDSSLDIFPK